MGRAVDAGAHPAHTDLRGRPPPAARVGGFSTGEHVVSMGEPGTFGRRLFGPHSNYFFDRNPDERQRLENQFHLLGEDFDRWFDEALRMGGLSTDPSGAVWSILDLGCGEGQFTRQVAQRYPEATVVGMDVDRAAVEAASRDNAAEVRFVVHD